MKWVLVRLLECAAGNFGILAAATEAEDHYLFTCEDDWRGNATGVSCIPPGIYKMKRAVSPHFGDVFEIVGVPGRSHILLHAGNTEEDTDGCVLLGLSLGFMAIAKDEDTGRPVKKLAVLQSKPALARFMAAMKDHNDGELEVRGL